MRARVAMLMVGAAAMGVLPARGVAQEQQAAASASVREALLARGLPQPLAHSVDSIAVRAAADGLPTGPLADKAVEGWAKHVPGPRILAAVAQFAGRMGDARAAVQAAGVSEPNGPLIRAAADAMANGINAPSVGQLVRAAREPGIAAPAITVAAALRAQGFSTDQAVRVVTQVERSGRSMNDLLDIPSLARAMQQQGMSPTEAGHHILDGTPVRGGGNEGGEGGGGDGGGHHDGGSGPPMPRPPRPGLPTLPHG